LINPKASLGWSRQVWTLARIWWWANQRCPTWTIRNTAFGSNVNRKAWTNLHRARAKVWKKNSNLHKWGLCDTQDCRIGEMQTMKHVLQECCLETHCFDQDLKEANPNALRWVKFWCNKIWWWARS